MSPLEQRYRRVLRLLPTAYRLRWEEEMVEAFLTSVETYDPEGAEFLAEFGRPSLAEVASVVALSLRLRLGLAGTPTPRSSAWGGAWRIVALAWLLAGAALMTAPLLARLWAPRLLEWTNAPIDVVVVDESALTANLIWMYAPLLWAVAFFALLLGRLRVARVLAVLLVARDVVTVVGSFGADLLGDGGPFWVYDGPTVLFDLCLLPTLWAFSPGRAVVPRRAPWVLAFVAAVGAVSANHALILVVGLPWAVMDIVGLLTVGVVTAALVHLVRRRHDPAWSLGLAILAAIVLQQRLMTLHIVAANANAVGPGPRVAAAIEIAALVLAAVPLAVVSARALARMRSDQTPAAAA
jgi:hypothetical protein